MLKTPKQTVARFSMAPSILSYVLLQSFSVQAQESTAVMPKGIIRMRAVTVFGNPITHVYDSDSTRQELMAALNRSVPAAVTVDSVKSKKPELKSLYDKLNAVEPGLGDKLFQTDITANAKINFQKYLATAEYGLTPKWTLGVIVPVAKFQVDAAVKVITVTQTDAIIKSKIQPMGPVMKPLADGLKTFDASAPRAITNGIIAAAFTDKGYQVPTSLNVTGIGDIEVGAKYRYIKTDSFSSAVTFGFRLPTAGHLADPSLILDRSTGDKQLDFEAKSTHQYELTSSTTLGGFLRWTYQMPDTKTRPIPAFGQSGLTDLKNPDNWDLVKRDLGDSIDTEVSIAQSFFNKQLSIYTAYQYLLKSQDMYYGSKNLNFAALEKNTAGYSHKYELGIGYSTLPLFIKKSFPVPLTVNALYNGTLYGKNVTDLAYTRVELQIFF